MKTRMKITISVILLWSLFPLISRANEEHSETGFDYPSVSMELFSPDSIKIEFESMLRQMQNTHPNLFMIVDFEAFFRVKEEILNEINRPMNQMDAFRLYSRMNPVLKDGHQAIGLPKFRDQLNEATKQGDRLFPLRVFIDKDFRLMVKSPSHGLTAGTLIHRINGVDAVEINKHMEQRMFGDNTDLRRNIIADRYATNLWLQYGSSKVFELEVQDGENTKTVRVDGITELLPHRQKDKGFEDHYSFEMLAEEQVGYLKANTFMYYQGYEQWLAFTDSLFAELRKNDSNYLIIDVRDNGGGDDQFWINGIMPYIAKKEWQRMLHFLGRVRDIDQTYPDRLGEVAIFDFLGEYEVSEKPKFDGEVYVIVGRKTYSSSIMFTSIIKDSELGKIVGQEERTLARGCSTGMSVVHDMPITGIFACTPQHWYQRNTGGSCFEGVEVDIQLNDNPFNEREIVEALVERLVSN